MDIKSADSTFQDVIYGDDSFDELINHLTNHTTQSSYHLSLLIGKPGDKKDKAVKKIANATGRAITTVDANEIISKAELESFENLDYIFEKFDPGTSLLYLKNGSRLCGVYTGYTQSRVKYATPQERYFLGKVKETGGICVIDMNTSNDADTTIRRAAQSVISFPLPQSMLKKLLWKLKGVSVHGHQIKTERPERYGETSGNF